MAILVAKGRLPGATAPNVRINDGPARMGFHAVMTGTQCAKVCRTGRATLTPRDCVIDLAVSRPPPTSREAAVLVTGLDEATQGCGNPVTLPTYV